MQLVISAFPGCSKSTICKNAEQYGLKHIEVLPDGVVDVPIPGETLVPVFDSDSSLFDKEHFPANYIEHIKEVLSNCPNVVIMVSSHDNVRKAMAEAGIPYTLVYPQRELKGDYLERYEGRGSPEAFVNMMDNKWNDFIDSAESDPSQDHIILSEGEYLVDRISDRIKEAVTPESGVQGFESLGDEVVEALVPDRTIPDTTAVIVDVNADASINSQIPAEPVGEVVVGVVNSPEDTEAATLDAITLEGGQPAVDASTVDDSALGSQDPAVVVGNEDIIGQTGSVDGGEQHEEDRADLIEAKFDMENDIDMLDKVIVVAKDPEQAGFESLTDNGEMMASIASDIKDRYDVEVEPTIGGMEGFLESLKSAGAAVAEALKGKPNKESLAKIKKYLFEADKAIAEYGTDKWLDSQKFINVGKTKLQVPEAFKDVTDVDGIAKIIEIYIKAMESQFNEQEKVAGQRFKSALAIFNKFKNRKVSEDDEKNVKEFNAAFPVTPPPIPSPKPGEMDALLKTTLSKGEMPVLNKDNVKEVVKLIKNIIDTGNKWESLIDKHVEHGLGYDELSDSDFISTLSDEDSVEVVELEVSLVWEESCSKMFEIQAAYGRAMVPTCKFLEMWILNSVK